MRSYEVLPNQTNNGHAVPPHLFIGNKLTFVVCYDIYSIELNILDKLKMCAGSVLGLVGAGRPCFHRMTVKQVPSTVGEVFIIEITLLVVW